MALLTFPASPVNNQLYPVTPTVGQNQYQWDSASGTWVLLGAATAVAPGTYGSSTEVAQFTVDTQGRLTFAQNVPIASGAGGTVTQVDTGTGLSGGPITGTGTVSLLPATASDIGGVYPDGTTLTVDGSGQISVIDAGGATLQTVTDNGATTTNTITLNKTGTSDTALVVRNGVGKAISVQGSGNIEFLSPSGGQFYSSIVPGFETLSFVVANGPLPEAIKIGSLSTDINNQLVASGLSYPVADGAAGEVLTTDGAGNLGWASTLKVVAAPSTQSDPGVAGDVAYNASYFFWHDGTDWQRVAAEPPGW